MTDTHENITEEARLKGILYRFMELQDRLQTERLAIAHQSANIDELIKAFTAQIVVLKTLAPQMQRQILETVAEGSHTCAERVGEVVAQSATEQVEKSSQELQASVHLAKNVLHAFEARRENSWYYVMTAFFAASIVTGFLVGKFAVPTPYLALTGKQLHTYENGKALERFWPKLSEKEQQRLERLANDTTGHNETMP